MNQLNDAYSAAGQTIAVAAFVLSWSTGVVLLAVFCWRNLRRRR